MILKNPQLSMEQMRAAWLARYGSGWVDNMDVWEDDLFFNILMDLTRLDCMDVDRAQERYRIKAGQTE